MEPYNPYAPPSATYSPPVPARGDRLAAWAQPGGTSLKWFFLGNALITFALRAGASLASADVGSTLLALSLLPAVVGLVLVLVWIYTTWSEIPAADCGDMTAGAAVGKLFIPFYNLYWMFSVSGTLCEVLNRALARVDQPSRVNKGLTVFACIVGFMENVSRIPELASAGAYVSFVAQALWFAHMHQADGARVTLAEPRARLW